MVTEKSTDSFLTRTILPVQATAPKSIANAILTRRQRSRTPQPSSIAEAQEGMHCRDCRLSQLLTLAAGTSMPTRRGRRLAPVTDPERDQNKVEKPPTKKGRKPYEVVTPAALEKEESTPPTIAKRGRARNKAAPSVEAPKTRAKPPSTDSRKPGSKGRSGSKAKSLEEDIDDEDPLNSYDITTVPHTEEEEEAESVPVKAVAVGKAKPKSTSNRRKPTIVKQEEEDPEELTPPVPTRVKRSTRANAASQPAVTPAVRATTSKTRGRPKTPATAPAAIVETSADPEKENAPGQHTGATSMEKAPEPEVEDAPVKLRISRATGRKAAKVDEEGEHPAPGRQKATRVMRTRTKTG